MRSRQVIRVEALYRTAMLAGFHRLLGIILVTEFPKSGASWLAQMLAKSTGYPFPRQEFPPFGKALYHGHRIGVRSKGPVVVVWRDPRDIMVSWYYHTLVESDKNHPGFVAQFRSRLKFDNVEDIRTNLPKFIDFNFKTPISPRFSFNDFFDYWYERPAAIDCRYEDLLIAPLETLIRVSNGLGFPLDPARAQQIVNEFSFQQQAKRAPGKENTASYLRKGVAGDWRNHFSDEAITVFRRHIGPRLIALGYEKGEVW